MHTSPEALSLAAGLLGISKPIDPAVDKDLAAAIRLALCLERDNAHRGGKIRQEPDLASLHRACLATRAIAGERTGTAPEFEDVVRWCIFLRCPVPEIALRVVRRRPRTRITRLGRRLNKGASEDLVKSLSDNLPDTTPSIDPGDKVVVQAGDPNDKIGQMDKAIESSVFMENLLDVWSRSGKTKEEFAIAIKPNISMIFRLADDGTYTDSVLVMRLIEKIMEQGFLNVSVVETQNLYGIWYGNREVVQIAAHGGYLDRKVFDAYEQGKPYFGKVLVRGEAMSFRIVDMTHDQIPCSFDDPGMGEWNLGRAWVEADYRINFPKFKTHFFNFYTALVKNSYGCLPEQDKIEHYHHKKITHVLTALQLASCPVHFSFVDAITGADGLFGAKMKAESKKTGAIVAGRSMLAVESLCAQIMGYDPYRSDFFTSAVKATGDLHAVRVEDRIQVLPGWRRVPAFVDDVSSFAESFNIMAHHFGHIFTGSNDPCFPHTGKLIRLRRLIAIFPYPVLAVTNLDQIGVWIRRRRLRRFCKANADSLPLSAGSKTFFNRIRLLSLADMKTLADFLESNKSAITGSDAHIERFGHRIRVGDRTIELVGMKHFAPECALEIFEEVRRGELDAGLVIRDLRGWQEVEIPGPLRKHLLIDSPYLVRETS